jgi:hypothetical protein
MRPKEKISCQEIFSLIPEQLLEQVAKDTKVDFSVSKLTGKNMFMLLLYGLISEKEVSLKILEDTFQSPLLQMLSGGKKVQKSSISYRLKKMKVEYFKQIFDHLVEDEKVNRYMGTAGKKYVLKKVDSTIVTLSAKLFAEGMRVNEGTRNVKFSVGIMDGLPIEVALFTEQTYSSEDKALKEIIQRKRPQQTGKINILLFDRGIQSRDTMDEIHEQKETFFVTRHSSQSYKVDKIHSKVKGRKAGELILQSDEEIHFESTKEKRDKTYRLVTAIHPETKKEYQFLTDILFLNAGEICDLYKQRWEIETFFKFIKQQLNFSHFVSRSLNGIAIMMYMTLIAAILIAIYKKINKVETWGSAKHWFIQELEANVLEIFFPFFAPRWGYVKNISQTLDHF